MRVPLLDLTRQYALVRDEVSRRVEAIFDSQQFVLGRTVEDFEKAFCDYVGCGHAVGMSSGTDAELALLMAQGIGAGDAVITTPYTFFATAGCIHRVGAEPVFIDVQPDTLHLDPAKLKAYLDSCKRDADGRLLTRHGNVIRLVVPVHLFGVCCDIDALREVTSAFDLPIMEDAAQAIGSEFVGKAGKSTNAGNLGDCAFFSFFPTKNLGAAGDAGMAVCQDGALAEKLRRTRNHGMASQYCHETVGGNFRLDALQATVLHAKLPHVANWNAARRRNADLYREKLGHLADRITLPAEPWKATGVTNHHTYHQYVIRADQRDDLKKHLAAEGIGNAVYYPISLHLQKCFAPLGYREGDLPESERASRETLALPIFPELTEEEILTVADAIVRFYS